jgi:hypothetical protein
MTKQFIFIILLLISFRSKCQVNDNTTDNEGIVYFSLDNGNTWVNKSDGLPNNINIALGGVACSTDRLGIATKKGEVFIYNHILSKWEGIPTEKQIIDAQIGALAISGSTILVGTQLKGIFATNNNGITWERHNNGINNLTIRRFCELNKQLYMCANDGFYLFDKNLQSWHQVFTQPLLQINGAALYKGKIYLATNKGIFCQKNDGTFQNIAPYFSVHNINANQHQLFAMTYNELLMTSFDGLIWQKMQAGLPKALYTFNVIEHKGAIFAGQWDGVYSMPNAFSDWVKSNKGLPEKFAVTNLITFKDVLVISTSERKLKMGMSTNK